MSTGVHVLGSSSMGALRASELSSFGMEGIGLIFQGFADGILEDDDEVTVVHGPQEMGFPPLSEAMVNIRSTLAAALNAHIIDEDTYDLLLKTAKNIHYKERNYSRITTMAECSIRHTLQIKRFLEWLPEGRQDQKRQDALNLIDKMMSRIKSGIEPKRVLYKFENSQIWNSKRSQ